jgi:ribosomal protein L16 Arg81 hydroxylase
MDFAEFLAPFDAGTFRSQYYGKQPLHVQKKAAGPGLLPWARFNEVLALTPYWNEDTLKVYYESRAALRENCCDTAELRPGTPAPVNPAKVKALVGLGASLVANRLHRVCPEVCAVAAMLEREFAARTPADVCCSFQGMQALQTHFDLHDVFAVQAEGEKTWRIYESRADAPVNPVPPATSGRSGSSRPAASGCSRPG